MAEKEMMLGALMGGPGKVQGANQQQRLDRQEVQAGIMTVEQFEKRWGAGSYSGATIPGSLDPPRPK